MCPPPLVEIGLTDLPKSGGHVPPPAPPLACDRPEYNIVPTFIPLKWQSWKVLICRIILVFSLCLRSRAYSFFHKSVAPLDFPKLAFFLINVLSLSHLSPFWCLLHIYYALFFYSVLRFANFCLVKGCFKPGIHCIRSLKGKCC